MKYGYVRISTQTQNIAREMEKINKLGLTDEFIFVDKKIGEDFNRKNYQLLKK